MTEPRGRCRCGPGDVARYRRRLSGPVLDRMDLHVAVPAVPLEVLQTAPGGESSAQVRARVLTARQRQRGRGVLNAHLTAKGLEHVCGMTPEAARLLGEAVRSLGFSARAYDKVRRIARTIADLAGADGLGAAHVAEAVRYRALDRLAP